MNLNKLYYLFALLILFNCSSDDDSNFDGGQITAYVNGRYYKTDANSNMTFAIVVTETSENITVSDLSIYGTNVSENSAMSLDITSLDIDFAKENNIENTYTSENPLNEDDIIIASVENIHGDKFDGVTSENVTITISEFDLSNNKVSGTFSFTINEGGAHYVVENGKFIDVPIVKIISS